ncbi:hypothetical protein PLESTM_000343600 [Pleodorina starrii]|nr:hypothetical protein PLESTM_000343600 [Pleodorina starrii]
MYMGFGLLASRRQPHGTLQQFISQTLLLRLKSLDSGVLLDLVNALELINALQSSGELTGSDALDLARAAKTLHDRRQEIRSGIILARIRLCGLCRQMGHNRATCPRR